MALISELEAHLTPLYPSESRHGYSVDKLMREGVQFFVLRVDGQPAGCGGVQFYEAGYGELKRMYVQPDFRGLGLGKRLLDHLVQVAQEKRVPLLRLETGIYQKPAIRLYERYGFQPIGPFGTYTADPLSLYFELAI
jgi:putative acetyltransferase